MQRVTAIAVVLALAGSLSGCCAPASQSDRVERQKKAQAVTIGFAAPLSGESGPRGEGMSDAVRLAIAEVNASDEAKQAGITFELNAQDDERDPRQAVAVAQVLVADPKVAAVVGHLNSGCSIPASGVYNKANLAMVSVSSNAKLTAQGFKVVDRVVPKDGAHGAFAAGLARKLGFDSVALVDDSTPYGQDLVKAFRARFEKGGGKIVSAQEVRSGKTDIGALVRQVKKRSPEAVFYGGAYATGALISIHAGESGLTAPLIGGDALRAGGYIEAAGRANAEGDICTALGVQLNGRPRGEAFIEAYKAAYERAPDIYDAYAYDSARIVMAAVLTVGGGNRAKVAAAIRAISYDGVTGTTAFDKNGDTTNIALSAYKVTGGKWVRVDE